MKTTVALFITALAVGLILTIMGGLSLSAAIDQADTPTTTTESSIPMFVEILAGMGILVASIMYFPRKIQEMKE